VEVVCLLIVDHSGQGSDPDCWDGFWQIPHKTTLTPLRMKKTSLHQNHFLTKTFLYKVIYNFEYIFAQVLSNLKYKLKPTLHHLIFPGKVPLWLEGSLYRVGPGIFQVGNFCYNHPFDMTAVLHKYTLFPNREFFQYQVNIL